MTIFYFLIFAYMLNFPVSKGDDYPEDEEYDCDGDVGAAEVDCDDPSPENPEKYYYTDNNCDEEMDNLAADAMKLYLGEDQYRNRNSFDFRSRPQWR